MAHLIDKDAVLTEIKRRYKLVDKYETNEFCAVASRDELVHLKNFINNLEVKEVDLEKELEEWIKYGPHTNYPWCTIPGAIKITAEHFFELGLKAQKVEEV